jgi:hypothetical protein
LEADVEPEDDPEEAVDAAGELGVAVPVPSMPNSGAVVRATFRALARCRCFLGVLDFFVDEVDLVVLVATVDADAGRSEAVTAAGATTGVFLMALVALAFGSLASAFSVSA